MCSVQVYTFELAEVKCLRGFWDGGFDDEFPEEVGLGFFNFAVKDQTQAHHGNHCLRPVPKPKDSAVPVLKLQWFLKLVCNREVS